MRKWTDLLSALAGLLGAAGVAAAAAAAHVAGGAKLSSVALILLVHAAAVLCLCGRAREDDPAARLWCASAAILALGAALFSADVSLFILRGGRLFRMAAPIGGSTMIFGWLVASAAGLVGFARGYR
jgi:uncharacterized membrane protein YgdD (TMEM256/DUF423 family)